MPRNGVAFPPLSCQNLWSSSSQPSSSSFRSIVQHFQVLTPRIIGPRNSRATSGFSFHVERRFTFERRRFGLKFLQDTCFSMLDFVFYLKTFYLEVNNIHFIQRLNISIAMHESVICTWINFKSVIFCIIVKVKIWSQSVNYCRSHRCAYGTHRRMSVDYWSENSHP
jgi:hypothetical protein